MKTLERLKTLQNLWINSSLAGIVIAVVFIFKMIIGIDAATTTISDDIKQKLVVFLNKEIVVVKDVDSDTIKVYVNTYHPDTLQIQAVERDSLTKDTLITDTLNRK